MKLMKWRLVPDLDLEHIKNTKFLLLGSGQKNEKFWQFFPAVKKHKRKPKDLQMHANLDPLTKEEVSMVASKFVMEGVRDDLVTEMLRLYTYKITIMAN